MYILGNNQINEKITEKVTEKVTEVKKINNYQKGLFKISGLLFKKQEVILFGVFILAIFFSFYRSKDRVEKLNKLLSNKFFTVSLFAIISFSVFILYFNKPHEDDKQYIKMATATKHAIIGFTIGILHHFEFNAAPFWIIWLTSYYLNFGE